MRIVVARYNENVEWTLQFPNVTIYNKGEPLGGDYTEISLPNVGREGHTYYKHIIDNYDKLDDYTVFLQGNPFDHSPNIISALYTILSYYTSDNLKTDYGILSEHYFETNLSGCEVHYRTRNEIIPMQQVYQHLFNERRENVRYIVGAGAQFIVSKEQILKRPREFYEKIVKLLEYDNNPIEGFVIERLHCIIFG
jgi:hypothetical protein